MFGHHQDMDSYGCVCGSAWNYIEKDCSFFYPISYADELDIDDYDYAPNFYECSHGHAFCARH